MTVSDKDLDRLSDKGYEFKTKATFSPLLISGGAYNTQDYWAIKFQSIPKKQVIIVGSPTKEQILDALSSSYMPAIMVTVFDIIVQHHLDNLNDES